MANLARLQLTPQELEKLSIQLHDILGFIDKLSQLNTDSVPPTSHILPISNVLREDELKPSLPIQAVLENSPQKKGSFFSVPKVIE